MIYARLLVARSLLTEDGVVFISIDEPHNPYQVCEPYYSMFPPESLPEMR